MIKKYQRSEEKSWSKLVQFKMCWVREFQIWWCVHVSVRVLCDWEEDRSLFKFVALAPRLTRNNCKDAPMKYSLRVFYDRNFSASDANWNFEQKEGDIYAPELNNQFICKLLNALWAEIHVYSRIFLSLVTMIHSSPFIRSPKIICFYLSFFCRFSEQRILEALLKIGIENAT